MSCRQPRAMLRLKQNLMLAATYKLNNLDLVPVGNRSRSPILPPDDLAVQLYRDSFRSEAELRQHFLNICH